MGRNSKYVEFLKILKDLMDVNEREFAKLLGKQYSNVKQYLNGQKDPGKRVVQTGLNHLSEWQVESCFEVEKTPKPLTSISEEAGIYVLYDSAGNILYAGQAINLRSEIHQTLNRKVNFAIRIGPNLSKKAKPKIKDIATHISIYIVKPPRLRHNLEALILRILPNQSHNNKLGNFK